MHLFIWKNKVVFNILNDILLFRRMADSIALYFVNSLN